MHQVLTYSLKDSNDLVVMKSPVTLSMVKVKSPLTSQKAHQAGPYLRFLYHEATRSICTPPWMGC